MSYLEHSLEKNYPTPDIQSVYSIDPADWSIYANRINNCHKLKYISLFCQWKTKFTCKLRIFYYKKRYTYVIPFYFSFLLPDFSSLRLHNIRENNQKSNILNKLNVFRLNEIKQSYSFTVITGKL